MTTTTLIDDLLPRWDFHEVHRITIDAPQALVLRAALEVTWSEVPVAALLMRLTRNDMTTYRKILGDIGNRLAEGPAEIVFGGVGSRSGPPELTGPAADAFRGFSEPGYHKTVMNVRYTDGVLSTETRILATDPDTRRKFRIYWTVIRLGSGFIRRSVLAAVRRRIKREQTRSPR